MWHMSVFQFNYSENDVQKQLILSQKAIYDTVPESNVQIDIKCCHD